jgi:hypothetical protein
MRNFGKMPRNNWREEWWTSLTTDAQWLYTHLSSSPHTDTAGVFPISVTKWVKAACDMTPERAMEAARHLVERGLMVADHDTEEGLLRTYIRDDWAGDNIFKGALNRALLTQSVRLRAVLWREIKQLNREFSDEALKRIDELEASIPGDFDFGSLGPTSPSPSTATTTQPSERRSNAVRTPLGPSEGKSCRECDEQPAQGVGMYAAYCSACIAAAKARA